MNYPSNSWAEIKNQYKPLFKDLTNRLNFASQNEFYTFFEIASNSKIHIKSPLNLNNVKFNGMMKTGQYIEKYGVG